MSSGTPTIVFNQATFAWPDGTVVLDGATAAFGPGRAGLIGDNGTGKTTVLRLVTGELTLTSFQSLAYAEQVGHSSVRGQGEVSLLDQQGHGLSADTAPARFSRQPDAGLEYAGLFGTPEADGTSPGVTGAVTSSGAAPLIAARTSCSRTAASMVRNSTSTGAFTTCPFGC